MVLEISIPEYAIRVLPILLSSLYEFLFFYASIELTKAKDIPSK
jgi:hypothetical protein